MNSTTQKEFMYLLERIGEPLYFGPKGEGENMIFYNVPQIEVCEATKHAAMSIKKNFTARHNVQVDSITTMPDLKSISRCCPKSTIFSYFNPIHRQAVSELLAIFQSQPNRKSFMSMACVCRDSDQINPKVWLNAFSRAMLTRKDTKGFRFPAFWEIMPDEFINCTAIRQAQKMCVMPQEDRPLLTLDGNLSARHTNPENKLWYFREDMAINSHHWHWHLVYGIEEGAGVRDRKGELFYYMHHSMMARYDAERMCNGLARTKELSLDDRFIPEPYFSKLTDSNSGLNWGGRQANTMLSDVDRTDDAGGSTAPTLKISLADIRRYRDRVMDAIDTGNVLLPNGKVVKLNIDMLGDMVESSSLTPNAQFYGDFGFHNLGHMMISFLHDPFAHSKEQTGPMADNTTAMRDPAFYTWHKYIDDIFDAYKRTLQPYTDVHSDKSQLPLKWDYIETESVTVITGDRDNKPNTLITFWMDSDIDLSRGLDFARNNVNNLGPIWARKTHLNHDPFCYKIAVKNKTGSHQRATVRIFMAPRYNENGIQFEMIQQRKQFFEMDKFTAELKPGDNFIQRSSIDSSLTIPWEQSFRELERNVAEPSAQQSVCGCGWPQHMLVPKGSPEGMVFDLVVFCTNAKEDEVKRKTPQKPQCKESMSFCGILDDYYPDAKPMGYPFDRNPYMVKGTVSSIQVPVSRIEDYVSKIPNMKTVQVLVKHMPHRKELRPGGAPKNLQPITSGVFSRPENCPEGNANTNSRNRPSGGKAFVGSGRYVTPGRYGRSQSSDEGSSDESWMNVDSDISRKDSYV